MSIGAAKKFYQDTRKDKELRNIIYKANDLDHCLALLDEQGYHFDNEEFNTAINMIRGNAQAETVDKEALEFLMMWNMALGLK